MRSVLYVSCSPRGLASHSLQFAEELLERLRQLHPGVAIQHRNLAADPPMLVESGFANAILDPASPPEAFAASEMLIRELEDADAVVIATPMHNYTVPAALKAWIDHVVRIHRTFASTPAGKVGKLADRPVFIVVVSGGWFSLPLPAGAPGQPDFLTPYLRAILNTIGLRDIRIIALEGVTRGPVMLERAVTLARQSLGELLPYVDPSISQG